MPSFLKKRWNLLVPPSCWMLEAIGSVMSLLLVLSEVYIDGKNRLSQIKFGEIYEYEKTVAVFIRESGIIT
jgi:hypothetical protein